MTMIMIINVCDKVMTMKWNNDDSINEMIMIVMKMISNY